MTPKELRLLIVGDELRNIRTGREFKVIVRNDSHLLVIDEVTRETFGIMFCQASKYELVAHQS